MPSLPIVPTQIKLRANVGSLDAPRASQPFTFGTRVKGIELKRVVNGLKESSKNRGRQWYAQSAHFAHTGHENGKCGFCGRFQFGPSIQFWPWGAGYCTERVVNGLIKSAKNRGRQLYALSAHWAHTDHENGKCGFCGRFQGRAFSAADLSTFDPRGQSVALRGW